MADCKICGIRTPADLDAAARSGARWAGMVFYPKSPRHLSFEEARALRDSDAGIARVALVVDADDASLEAIITAAAPDLLQCHGHETPARMAAIKARFGLPLIKAIRVKDADTLAAALAYDAVADLMLFDSAPTAASLPGGTGHAFDWPLMRHWQGSKPWLLAGGLTPENVSAAIEASGAEAVDVSSGVESAPGIKDHAAIQRFVSAAL